MTSESTEMEMRVALAIYKRKTVMPNGELHLMKKTPWEKLQNISRVKYLNDARAAIRAMRTPTTEMLREAGMVVAGNTEAHATVWETMITAASPQEE
jgi:hypothetical protein